MAVIKHQEIDKYLKSLSKDDLPSIVLIFGEEYLTRKIFAKFLDHLVPLNFRELQYELLEGEQAIIPALIERISTYSLMQEKLVVAVKDAPLFPTTGTKQVYGYLKEDLENLQKFIKKGFPENHFLIFTTSAADKRRVLFKSIQSVGIAIDCSVLSGSRMADKKEQNLVLRSTMEEILLKHKKGIDGDAFNLLVEKTGFNPTVLADNLEKLVSFIGVKASITYNDVASIVKRSKIDAIFELTNAVAEKNGDRALFYLKSLSDAGFHPLQILAALINQIRKLVVVKDFIEKSRLNQTPCWHAHQDYNRFKQNTMPEIVKADQALTNKIEQVEDMLFCTNQEDKPKKKKVLTDLFIAPNPKNSYPVFHLFLKSDNFSLDELTRALMELSEIDFKLKSSAGNPMVLLENFIIRIAIHKER
ncbi:MAG: DNA polymerase III subunit delta [Thermodesulfobacteriota bacterium]|nr:DNA polymerase III subunit delta [Thermodesulfobacteriota bacterium]